MVDGAPTENDGAPAPAMANGRGQRHGVQRTLLIVRSAIACRQDRTDFRATLTGDAVNTTFCGPLGKVCWKSALLSSCPVA